MTRFKYTIYKTTILVNYILDVIIIKGTIIEYHRIKDNFFPTVPFF